MKRFTTIACLALALVFAVSAVASDRILTSQDGMFYGGSTVKASGDTIDLMGPGTGFPYRGDFELSTPRPGSAGALTSLWYSSDQTSPPNYWHVDTYNNAAPMVNKVAWCGSIGFASCGSDPVGGYGNDWLSILEFRKTVTAGLPRDVRVQANLRWDSEPGYDGTTLARRTQDNLNFEPIAAPGQGKYWDGLGDEAVDFTFNYLSTELVGGTDVAVAFVFDSDGGWSDGDCLWPTAGATILDNITVTVSGTGPGSGVYIEDFEVGTTLGPDWLATPNVGVGNFAAVWSLLGDADDCASNYSNLVAFIDDGLVVPGTGPSYPTDPINSYGPPGGYIVNCTGGLLGPTAHIDNAVYSPVMNWPVVVPALTGMSYAFDVYRHELLIANDTPGIFYTWGVRSAPVGGDLNLASWVSRNFVYYGGPNYLRAIFPVDDLIVANVERVQVQLGVVELGYAFGYGEGTNGTPAPYFDNARVKVYPGQAAFMAITEIRMANDNFPAIGTLDYVNLERNSVRFDMAANIALRAHLRNDPGDSIWIDTTPRSGGTLDLPVMHWKFAVKNPLFTPAMRTNLVTNPAHNLVVNAGDMDGAVTGRVTRTASGNIVNKRYNFDLPDTGFLFPGDVLHYYFAVTDHVGGDTKVATAPLDLSGFGNPTPMAHPGVYEVNCLPSIKSTTAGDHPTMLFWNDFGYRGGEDEWYGALTQLGLVKGTHYDTYTTTGPSSGVGNGLGGRATGLQLAGYTDMLYSVGDLSSPTLSNGAFTGDPGNDLLAVSDWLAGGGKDMFLTGDDLASGLFNGGAVSKAFLENKLGVLYSLDTDLRDNIGGQTAPLVKSITVGAIPVFPTALEWTAYGGCFGINDFDNITTFGTGVRVAQFTGPGGATTPYPYSAMVSNLDGTNKLVSMNHDLLYVIDPAKAPPAPLPARTVLLSKVLDYFGVSNNPLNLSGTDLPGRSFTVSKYPNPFNPSLTIKYTLKNPGDVVMKVFNIRGELVKTLINGPVASTEGSMVWNGTNDQGGSVSSGVYFVETRSAGEVNVQKATMLK